MNSNALPSRIFRQHLSWLTDQSGKLCSFALLAAILGFAPVVDGIFLRSHDGFGVQPNWLETMRILDFPEILMELLVIVWARYRGLDFRQYWRVIPMHLKVAGVVFVSTFWVGAVFSSPMVGVSLLRSSYWVIHLAFGFAVYHLLKSSTINVKWFVNWQVGGLAILTAITALYLGHIALFPASYADKINWAGIIPGCMSVRHFGLLTGAVAALYIGQFVWDSSRKIHWGIALTVCTWLLGLTVWSGTRAAVVGLFVGFILMAIATKSLPQVGKLGLLVVASVLAVLLSTPLLPPDPAFGLFRLAEVTTQSDINALSSGRLTIWFYVWDLFADRWAFGWGEGSMYAFEIKEMGERHLQPHNSVMQFLYSWGLFATSAMAVIIASVLWYIHKKVALHTQLAAPLLMADVLLIMSLFDGTLFFSRMIMPTVFCLALCLAFIGQNKPGAAD